MTLIYANANPLGGFLYYLFCCPRDTNQVITIKTKNILALLVLAAALVRLIFFVFGGVFTTNIWMADQLFSFAMAVSILLLWDRLRITIIGFLGSVLLLTLHNLGQFGFYNKSFFGLTYDIYMHTLFGLVAGYVAWHYFDAKKYPTYILTILVVVGLGGLHEIVEVGGALAFGEGEGFLLFGPGDEGSFDAIKDLTMNLLGGVLTLITCFSVRLIKKKA